MEKLTLKIYDKLIVGILFSAFFLTSCEPDEPTPAYGIVPMYGAPTTTVSVDKVPDTNTNLQK
jgi:PBP1b-binding outer membrane lipoprotein LpoB